jgi:hypothetical protein
MKEYGSEKPSGKSGGCEEERIEAKETWSGCGNWS